MLQRPAEWGNFILGRDAFETEAPPPSVEQHSDRARGRVEGRYITIVHTPHLLHPELTQEELTQRVKECVSLANPGPHVIVLVIQTGNFTEADRKRVDHIFRSLEVTNKYTLVITQNIESGTSVDRPDQNVIEEIISGCSNRNTEFSSKISRVNVLEMMEEIVKENRGNHLICEEYQEALEHLAECGRGPQWGKSTEQEKCGTEEENSEGTTEEHKNTAEVENHENTTELKGHEYGAEMEEAVTKQEKKTKDVFNTDKGIDQLGPCGKEPDMPEQSEKEPDKSPLLQRGQDQSGQSGRGIDQSEPSGGGPDQSTNTASTNNDRGLFSSSKFSLKPDKTSQASNKKLNLVLFGSEEKAKASVSNILMNKNSSPSELGHSREQRAEPSSECVRREGEVFGHLLTLLEIPALYNSQLSEEEVMRETFHCVSLCDPGVHAFLFIINNVYITDEDEREMEKIHKIFSPRMRNHSIILFTQQSQKEQLREDRETIVSYGRAYHFCISKTKAPKVIQWVNSLLTENEGRLYTKAMYVDALIETQLKYKKDTEVLKQQIGDLQIKQKRDKREELDELRIVLLGKTGVGKSATGNTILGTENTFREDLCSRSVTTVCQKETTEIQGRRVTVIDTPGLFDTRTDNVEIQKEIAKCITMAAPGPHVFLLVLSVGSRFTKEEKEAVKMIQELFGYESRKYTMVVFTRGDDLRNKTIEQYVEDSEQAVKDLIDKCRNIYHVFNNQNPKDRTQVTALLNKISTIVNMNGGSCYTNEMFQQTEKALKEEQERILKEREAEIEREKEEMKRKHEGEMEKMKRMIEEEQIKQESERRRREKEFKEREEEIKREMAEREQLEREEYKKRREEDEKRMKEWMEQINREKEKNKKQLERQREEDQRLRDQEKKERRRREHEWEEKQRKEKEKFDQEKEEMIQKQKDHEKKLQQEYEQKKAEEEQRRAKLEEQIRHAEESKKKELQEIQLNQKQEWERMMKEEEKRREDRENMWRQTLQSEEEKWTSEQQLKQQQHEQEKKIEMEKRTLEEKERKLKEEEAKKRIEYEANEKIKQLQRNMELQRETEARQREEKYQKELEEKLRSQQETFHKEEEERLRALQEEEERKMAYMKRMHEEEKETLCKKTEQEARQQAEREFCIRLDEKVKEAKTEGHKEGFIEGSESVEAQRTKVGKGIDAAVNNLWFMFN